MEQLVIIAIVGLISLVNWLIKRSAEVREERRLERLRKGIPEGDPYHADETTGEHPTPPSPPIGNPSTDMRRLLEALGLPADGEIPLEPPSQENFFPEPSPPPLPPSPPRRKAPLPRFENPKPAEIAPSKPEVASPLIRTLHSQGGLRQAILLREILGPPKAFTT